jgi:hypothetical protein
LESSGAGAIATKFWRSFTSPLARLRAHERRKVEKIAALEARLAGMAGELRERITALEAALQKCPGEVCLFCGERRLRLKKASGPIGSGRGTWRRETWVCEACGKEDWRHRNYPD